MVCFNDKLLDSITSNLSPKCSLFSIVNLHDFKNILEKSVPVNIRLYPKGV